MRRSYRLSVHSNVSKSLQEYLREECGSCEFYGRKLTDPPYFLPCQLRINNVEDCAIHQSIVLRVGDYGGWENYPYHR